MLNLFKTEFLRYRNRALLAALVHMALLAFLQLGDADINATPTFPVWVLGSMAASAGFGILQMNGHKRINHWIYLLQRPLAPWKIATAVAGAGCALVLIALALPYALNIVRLQLAPAAGIELRHYLQLAQVVPALLLMYVYAGFCALYTHKLKFIGLAMFIGPVMNLVGIDTYLILILIACTVAVCFYGWFKPDLATGATRPLFIVVSELPLLLGMFWGLVFLYAAVNQVRPLLLGSEREPGTIAALQVQDGREVMLAALESAAPADAAFYRQQAAIGEVITATARNNFSYPNRNQRPSLDNALVLTDPQTNASWRFSHSAMLFKGVNPRTDAMLGWLGPEGFVTELRADSARFASVPWVSENRFILDDTTIYQLDWEQRALREKFTLAGLEPQSDAAGPERFSDSLGIHPNFVTLLSNRNLYLFRSRQFNDFNERATLETRLPHPENNPRTATYVMELIDGYLVAQLASVFPDVGEGEYGHFEQGALYLHATGTHGNRLVSERAVASGYTAADLYEGFVFAPGFKLLNVLVNRLVRDWDREAALPLLYHRFPPAVLVLALCSMLISGAVVGRLLRRVALPRKAKVAWVAVCTFAGLLGLASFYFGTWRNGLSMQIKANEARAPSAPNLEVSRA